MAERNFDDLAAFAVVAREQSFTRAAAKLGVSQSALSQTIRNLEERLQMRLLSRTTRKVSPTEIGEQLLASVEERFHGISDDINRLRGLADTPSGTIRISSSPVPTETLVWPKLAPLLEKHPNISIEIDSNSALADIVGDRFDAGVRLGEQVDKDMIAIPIGPPERMIVVGSPDYFARRGIPSHPRELITHDCVLTRMPTAQAPIPWEFDREGETINVRVSGRIIGNNQAMRLNAVQRGFGITWMLREPQVEALVAEGTLIAVLDDWCEPFPGFHLYYPNRRQKSVVFDMVIQALRYHD